MLGGIAQAEVNDQLKDLDESSYSQKFPSNWKSFSPSPMVGAYASQEPIYQVYGQQSLSDSQNSKRKKKNSGQTGNHGLNQEQQSKFPLVGSLVNYTNNKSKGGNRNKQKKSNSAQKNNNFGIESSGWNQQMNKKQRSEQQQQASIRNSQQQSRMVLRPVLMKNKQARDEHLHKTVPSLNRIRMPPQEMRPPPQIKPKTHLILKKVA